MSKRFVVKACPPEFDSHNPHKKLNTGYAAIIPGLPVKSEMVIRESPRSYWVSFPHIQPIRNSNRSGSSTRERVRTNYPNKYLLWPTHTHKDTHTNNNNNKNLKDKKLLSTSQGEKKDLGKEELRGKDGRKKLQKAIRRVRKTGEVGDKGEWKHYFKSQMGFKAFSVNRFPAKATFRQPLDLWSQMSL